MVEEKEAIERLYNMKNDVDVALMNSRREKGDWLYDDVQGTSDTLRIAINAIKKQEKIKEAVANSNKWSKEDIVVKAQAFCEIEKILRSDEEYDLYELC